MNKEIEIPENYEARIEGNKVIFELKESVDEKIRKYIVSFVELNKGVNLPPDEADKILAYLEKQKEQKPAEWNEEDEELAEDLIKLAEYYTNTEDETEFKPHIYWLKDLPNRFNLQPKQEWSEEDERILKRLIRDYDEAVRSDNGGPWGKVFQENLAWLKSRRPQPHWKPSEKQMEVDLEKELA